MKGKTIGGILLMVIGGVFILSLMGIHLGGLFSLVVGALFLYWGYTKWQEKGWSLSSIFFAGTRLGHRLWRHRGAH